MASNQVLKETKQEEWKTVQRRVRKKKPTKAPEKLDRKYVLEMVGNYVAAHNTKPLYGCVYGSVARDSHRIGSDVDILLLYNSPSKNRRPNASHGVNGKIYITDQKIRIMKQELELLLDCKVDLRVYFVRNNEVFVPEESMWFAECAQTDSVPIYQNSSIRGCDDYFKTCFFTSYINY